VIMLRLCHVAGRHVLPPACRCTISKRQTSLRLLQTSAVRHSGASSGGGRAASAIATTLLFTIGVGGGVVGYAAFDDKFRQTLEESVPGGKDVLDTVLGPLEEPVKKKKDSVPPPKLKLGSPVMMTKPKEEKKVEQDMTPKVEKKPEPPVEVVSPPLPPVVEVPLPPLEASPVVEVTVVPPPPLVELPPVEEPVVEAEIPAPAVVEEPASEPVVEETAVIEEPVAVKKPRMFPSDVENDSLDQVLNELKQEMKSATESAVKSMDKSAEAVVSHISIMTSVLESNLAARDDNSWNQVFEAATAKSDALKLADKKEKEALAAIRNVADSVEAGRRNKTTATNPELLVAEEAVNAAIYKLEQGRARIGAVEGEARVVEQYRDIVEEGRQQFNKEMAAIMPDVKLGENNKRLTEDELNMFITHAYRKVLYLQQELAKQQTLEQQRFKQALEKLKIEAQMTASEKMDNEMERQKREMEVEHQKRLVAMREDAEAELRIQLRRQAAAHSDHITDVLTIQEVELTRKHEHNMDEKLSNAETSYLTNLAKLNGSVEGLVSALESRSDADKASVSAQKLWMACLSLRNSIELGNLSAENLETTMKPLSCEIKAIKDIAGECEVVNAIVTGIPAEAVERGVYTETALRDRFNRVESVARRVARIGDEGGSLFMYGLSYLESMLLIDTATRSPTGSNEPLDLQNLNCHAILSEARHSLERGDVVRAVQFMRLLEGEPRRVASDWISEARLHLEARQASQALIAHAAAVSLQVLP
jgi:mitofilin